MATPARATEPILPVNPEAERSILGAILLDNRCYLQAASLLSQEDFSLDSHRRIYSAMAHLGDNGRPIDYVTLTEELGRRKEVEAIGGVAYLTSLTDGLPRTQNIEHYIKIVRDKAMLRAIVNMTTRAYHTAVAQQESAADVLENIQQDIIEMLYRGQNGHGVDVKDAGRETLNALSLMRKTDRRCIGIPTGIDTLDELTTGWRAKEFYVIGARPGQGKTALMCQAMVAAVQAGHRPGLFSIEVDRQQILTRLACQVSHLNVFDSRDPRVMDLTSYNALREAIATVSCWPFFMDDGRMTPKRLAAIARMWVSKGCDVLYVDYLQKLASRAPGKTEYERVTATADALWELARFVGVPVVALSQLRRLDRSERDRPPTLDDLRSSGEIEQNANAAILIYRPKTEDDEGKTHYTGEDQLIVAKQRSGPASMYVPVRFNGPVGYFEDRK